MAFYFYIDHKRLPIGCSTAPRSAAPGSGPLFESIKRTFSLIVILQLLLCLLVFGVVEAVHEQEGGPQKEYLNQFAIHVEPGPGADAIADKLAQKFGFINKGQIGSLEGHYLFVHNHISKRSTQFAYREHSQIIEDGQVIWAEQQYVKKRVKRDSRETDYRYETQMPDPLFNEQWYLNKGARGGFDMNVAGAWALGYTGKGVVVTILDDGIQSNHPDLVDNYDPKASFDINDNDPDPTPQDNGDNKHGTRCAGEVSAVAYNEYCGVGIAFNASIGGVRMLDGTVTDEVEAKALSLNPDHVDIYSASWGPEDDGKTVDGPGRLAQRAFIDGIRKGRRGRGSIFVWASGNGGRRQDNCNCDGYTNSIYTLSISSATQNGAKPWYLEECSSTLATTYSSGSPGTDQNIVTVDMDMSYFKSLKEGEEPVTSYLCTLSHTGTSASAPIAAAMSALALEANPNLSWRDLQHIVISTSRYEPLRFEGGWITNGVGRKVSHKFGYGLMDAEGMVRLAERWQPAPAQRICESPPDDVSRDIPADNNDQLEVSMNSIACKGTQNEIRYLEHVQARLTLKFKPRGNLKITLLSPSGTPSNLLLPRTRDSEDSSFNHWPFLSVHFWGEEPAGTWKLFVKNEGSRTARWPGKLLSWSLVFHGTYEKPQNFDQNRNNTYRYLPRRTYKELSSMNECAKQGMFDNKVEGKENNCVKTCPKGYFGDYQKGICGKCHEQCVSCYGQSSDNCLACIEGHYYYGDRCLTVCPDTHYSDEPLHECLPCSSNCRACHGSPGHCKTCRGKLTLDPNNHCVASCKNNTDCLKCQTPCSTCFDGDNRSCLSCEKGFRLVVNECSAQPCSEELFEHIAVEGKECRKCHFSCKSCAGPSHEHCLSCHSNSTLKEGLCYPCPQGQFMNQATLSCEVCHPTCDVCSGPTSSDCIHCDAPLFLDGSKCVPCCSNQTNLIEPDGSVELSNCCKCYNSIGPCISEEHTRSIFSLAYSQLVSEEKMDGKRVAYALLRNPNAVIATICITTILMFVSVFVLLQFVSFGRCRGRRDYRDYKKLGTARYDKKFERISLTGEDNGEEDSLFEKT